MDKIFTNIHGVEFGIGVSGICLEFRASDFGFPARSG